MDNVILSEEDTKKRYIEPALSKAKWDFESIKMEYRVKAKDYLNKHK
ncbi:hypothetical protein [uncultured Helicobacter sp.]|nr:hypothetical protein [uncultured Helicobacter sp.]